MPTIKGRGAGAIRKGGRGEQRRLRGAAMRAERRERTDSAGLLAAGHSRSSAARGTRRVVRGTAGTSRPLHPNPGSPLAPEGPPLPEGDGPHPTRCLGGEAPSVPAAPAPPGASSAPTPPGPRPGAPPPETGPPSPAAAAPTVRLTSAALRTDGRAGGPAGSAAAAAREGAGDRARTLLSASSGRREPQGTSSQPHHAAARSRNEGHGGRESGGPGAQRPAGGGGGGCGAARARAGACEDRRRLSAPRQSSRSSARSRLRGTPPRARPPRVTSARPAHATGTDNGQSECRTRGGRPIAGRAEGGGW